MSFRQKKKTCEHQKTKCIFVNKMLDFVNFKQPDKLI